MIEVLSGKMPVVYSSATSYLDAERIAQDTNGIPVMDCPEVYEFARLNNTGILYADTNLRPKFVPMSNEEYMRDWAEVSGRDYLGTP